MSIHPTAILQGVVTVAPTAIVEQYVMITGPVVIGERSRVNVFTVIYGSSGVTIGNDVMIAPHCVLVAGNHDYRQTDKPMNQVANVSAGPIVIEDEVWIGAHSTVTDGVRIGRGAVIGAGSVVTHDVAPNEIVAGVPARRIGRRSYPWAGWETSGIEIENGR